MERFFKNLVKAGPQSRVVEYVAEEGVEKAIRRVFSDVSWVAQGTIVLQRKDDEWGEFVDVGMDKTIPDRCVLRVELESLQGPESSSFILPACTGRMQPCSRDPSISQQQDQDEEDANEEECLCGVCGELYEDETDEPQIWIQCDLCGQWLHCSCEQLSAPPPPESSYICVKCQK